MKILLIVFLVALHTDASAQKQPTRADTLRGMLTPLRTCYDVRYYNLDLKIDPSTESISGSTTIRFTATTDFDRMQVDLFPNMRVDRIEIDDTGEVAYTREFGAIFVTLPHLIRAQSNHDLKISYSGQPQQAKRPPWEGGFTWTKDSLGNPWIAVTCQGTGASLWWPNKDHQDDEPDSVLISVTVPSGLQDVSNGRLRSVTDLGEGWTRYDWFVSYPINNYNITVNVGMYAHFGDVYVANGDTLTLDYYVMPYNLERAAVQFAQVKPMMAAFEKHFGKYPFPRDGYKLVEAPHLGMEHQSAVAYGNGYINGYRGGSGAEVGTKFDFIIVHETAHEWWGNSVTSKDIADMWIHESFGAYAEALYVEELFGYEEAMKYVNGKKWNVRNDAPIIGVYNVHQRGSGDMYDKGQLVLNTLRHVIANDSLWFAIVRGLHETYKYRTIAADSVFEYINRMTGKDYTYFFNQYFRTAKLPVLELLVRIKGGVDSLRYRWRADVQDFRMPVKVTTAKGQYGFISPTTSWQSMPLGPVAPDDFRVDEDHFLIDVQRRTMYIDPRVKD
jgi:aminopeptidase N